MGLLFDIKRFALHDGPGIRTTVFFKGCSMACESCHNPESQLSDPERFYRRSRCRLCGDCVTACEGAALTLETDGVVHDPKRCLRCGACTGVCRTGAANLAGFDYSPEEVMEVVEKDRIFYDQSRGGVTFSGGEPLVQSEFLIECLQAAKARSLHTVVDTSGHAPRAVLERVAPWVDLFLFDVKQMDDARHRAFTGVSNTLIIENLERLVGQRSKVMIRCPLIPGFNDDAEHLERLGRFAAALPEPPPVDLLPYHRAGASKYERLDRPYRMAETMPPSVAACASAAKILMHHGLEVTVKGEPHGSE